MKTNTTQPEEKVIETSTDPKTEKVIIGGVSYDAVDRTVYTCGACQGQGLQDQYHICPACLGTGGKVA